MLQNCITVHRVVLELFTENDSTKLVNKLYVNNRTMSNCYSNFVLMIRKIDQFLCCSRHIPYIYHIYTQCLAFVFFRGVVFFYVCWLGFRITKLRETQKQICAALGVFSFFFLLHCSEAFLFYFLRHIAMNFCWSSLSETTRK